mgnify:CR=1 FL=1
MQNADKVCLLINKQNKLVKKLTMEEAGLLKNKLLYIVYKKLYCLAFDFI